MDYVYPAVFAKNDDGTYTITYPDLPGCISEGKTLANAIHMAERALTGWIEYLQSEKEVIPAPSDVHAIPCDANEFVNLICVDIRDTRAVKRTISLPSWMDTRASEAGLSLSRVVQDALSQRFQ